MILLVEDEYLVRLAALEMLRSAGFAVVEASSTAEAITTLMANPDINTLFSDVEMPGGADGLALAHTVHETHPEIAILLTSGRRNPMTFELPPGCRFIAKPYDERDVLSLLHQIRH